MKLLNIIATSGATVGAKVRQSSSNCNLTAIDLAVNETMATPETYVVFEPKASEACTGASKSIKTFKEEIPNCAQGEALQKMTTLFEEFMSNLPGSCNGTDLQEYMSLTKCWSKFYSDPQTKLLNNHLVEAIETIYEEFPGEDKIKAVCALPKFTIDKFQPLAKKHCQENDDKIIHTLTTLLTNFYKSFCDDDELPADFEMIMEKIPEPNRSKLQQILDSSEQYENQWETVFPGLIQIVY